MNINSQNIHLQHRFACIKHMTLFAESLVQFDLMMMTCHLSLNLIHEAKAKMQVYLTGKHITMLDQFVIFLLSFNSI